MNLYTKLKQHLDRHQYKRGQYKGDAPADASRRARSHFRVRDLGSHIAVRFHFTDIIRAYPDGRIILDSNGWHSSPTTREAYAHYGFWLASRRYGGYSQTALVTSRAYSGPTVPFEDGMLLIADGNSNYGTPTHKLHPDYKPKPFTTRVADKEARKEFRNDEDVKAFRAALPVLHAGVAAMPHRVRVELSYSRPSVRHHPSQACDVHDNWPVIVAKWFRDTPAETWAAYYAEATKGMTKLEEIL